ncbi:MAG: ribosome biogenesis factor YjgA [Formosimonas sp.]
MTQTHYNKDGSRIIPEHKSKTAIKKEMHELQDLGAVLTELSKDRLAQVPMSDNLREAVKEYNRLPSHGARRRQMQFIGKIIRSEDVAPIQAKIDEFKGVSTAATALLHRIERLRNQLLTSDDGVTQFLADYPHADVQALRTLVRNTRKELELAKPPKSFRELFQMVKLVLETEPAADE